MADSVTDKKFAELSAALAAIQGKPIISIMAKPEAIINAVAVAREILGDILVRLDQLEKEGSENVETH